MIPLDLPDATEGDAVPVSGDVTVLAVEQDKRTYAVPRSAADAARQGLRWHQEYGIGDARAVAAADLLTSGQPLRISAVAVIADAPTAVGIAASAAWTESDGEGNPNADRVNHALSGGDAGQRWARRIVRRSAARSAMAAAAEQAQAVVAAATKDAVVEDLSVSDDSKGMMEYAAQIETMRQQPYVPHPYIPPLDSDGGGIDEPCEVCGANEPALVHLMDEMQDDDADTPDADVTDDRTADGSLVATAAALCGDDLAQRSYAVGTVQEILSRRAASARNFYLAQENVTDTLGTEYYVAITAAGSVVRLYAEDEPGKRRCWDARGARWDDVDDGQPEDGSTVVPIDSSSAYGTALLFSTSNGEPVPLQDIDPVEWAIAEEASPMLGISAEEPYPPAFCVDEADAAATIYVSDGIPGSSRFLVWDPALVEFVESASAPRSCTPVDEDEAQEIAMGIVEDLIRNGSAPGASATVQVIDPFGNPVMASALIEDIEAYSSRVVARVEEAFDAVRWITAGAVTAAGGGLITDGEYTPDERSRNAAAQFRDRLGRFSKVGDIVSNEAGRSAQVMSYDPASGMAKVKYSNGTVQQINVKRLQRLGDGPAGGKDVQAVEAEAKRARRNARSRITKAVMRSTLPLLSPEDIKQLLADYEADVAKRRRGLTAAALTPDNSDVPPLYLAVVDAIDNEAVVDLLALVPASATSTAPQIFIRTGEGWTPDPKMLMRIKSTSPPPLVRLENDQVPDIMAQVDSYFKEKGSGASAEANSVTAAAAVPPAGQLLLWGDDGTLLPPTLRAGGVPGIADTPEDFAAVRRLRRYWLRGPGALKIRWNTPGDYRRCVRHLRKYVGVRANGLCANYHHAATGMWTGDARHRKLYGKKRGLRGSGVAPQDRDALMYVRLTPATTNVVSAPLVAAVVLPTVDEVAAMEFADQRQPALTVDNPIVAQSADGPVLLAVVASSDIRGWSPVPAVARWDDLANRTVLLPDDDASERR